MKKLFLLPLLLCANILIGQTILTQTETVPITCYGGTATIDVTTDATANFNYQVQNLVNGNWVNTFPVQTNTSPPNFQIFLFAATWRIILIDISSGLQVFASTARKGCHKANHISSAMTLRQNNILNSPYMYGFY